MKTTEEKLKRFSEVLSNEGLHAYLAWHPVSMQYLHGYGEDPGRRFMLLALHRDGRKAMICPALAANQAERAGIQPILAWRDGQDPVELFKKLLADWKLGSSKIGIDDELPAKMLISMQTAAPQIAFVPSSSVLGKVTRFKDKEELANMRKAGQIADQALPAVLEHLLPGATEDEMADRLLNEMERLGGKPTFAVVAAGPNGAEPHHLSDSTKIAPGDVVVMDFGCTYNGYHSDITRTVCCGQASDEAKLVYRTVYNAHMGARQVVRPNSPAEVVDRAARSVIRAAGFGDYFIHRTGHGIGMRIHEDPYIVEGNSEPLAIGECFSIEPGIYLSNRFGVRIENIVTVTNEGLESLNVEPAPTLVEVA